MLEEIKSNYKILQEAIKNGEPAHYIIFNILKKLVGYSDLYIPSRNLSLEKGYNIYLNKKYDKWKKEKPKTLSHKCCFLIIKTGNSKAFETSLKSLKKYSYGAKTLSVESNDTKDVFEVLVNLNKEQDWVIILRAGDEVFPWIMARILNKIEIINNEKAILFDHDIKQDGMHDNAHLKPFFNKRYLLEYDLIQNALCLRIETVLSFIKSHKSVFDSVYNWLLDQSIGDFQHIQEPLISISNSFQANYFDILQTKGIGKVLTDKSIPELREISFKYDESEKVSIIIPFRDKPELLRTCINSILSLTNYSNYEIILADNNSEEQTTIKLLKDLLEEFNHINHIKIDHEFNFSLINNEATKISTGKLLLFLNNDTEVLHKGWLQQMVSEIQQTNVGAVGPQLLYEDLTIQHAGVVPGIGHVAGHVFRNFNLDQKVAMHRIQSAQEVAAITGACLLTKKDLFLATGGFDQDSLKIAYNDVDYCFKLLNMGYDIIYTPHVTLKHYESKSRKFDLSSSEKKRYDQEVDFMINSHSELLSSNQFYHQAYTRLKEDYSYKK